MSREIKFRVWAGSPEYKMYYPGDAGFALTMFGDAIHNGSGNWNGEYCWARIGFNGVEVMQFTGLKDASGAEIWEGDVFIWTETMEGKYGEDVDTMRMGEVLFADGCFVDRHTDYAIADMEIEVIGNIYQPPGILENT